MCRHVITETRKSERVVHHEREDYGQGSVLLLSQLPHRSFSEWNGHAFDDIAIRVTGQWQFMVHQRHMVHLTQISGMLSLFHTIDYCFLPLCPGRGTAVATHFARFFSNDSDRVMINVLFLLFLFVYAEGKAHGRESTAFFVQAVHNPRTAVYVA